MADEREICFKSEGVVTNWYWKPVWKQPLIRPHFRLGSNTFTYLLQLLPQ